MSEANDNEKVNNQTTRAKDKKSHTALIAIVAGAVILFMGGTIIFLLLRKPEVTTEEPERELIAANTVVTEDNVDEVIAELAESDFTPVGSYEISMPTDWTFPDGASTSSDAFVENVVNNLNTVYVDVELASTGEVIYHSPYLEVGARLQDIKLDKELDAGTYEAVITYYLVDNEFRDISSVSVGINLIVEN